MNSLVHEEHRGFIRTKRKARKNDSRVGQGAYHKECATPFHILFDESSGSFYRVKTSEVREGNMAKLVSLSTPMPLPQKGRILISSEDVSVIDGNLLNVRLPFKLPSVGVKWAKAMVKKPTIKVHIYLYPADLKAAESPSTSLEGSEAKREKNLGGYNA